MVVLCLLGIRWAIARCLLCAGFVLALCWLCAGLYAGSVLALCLLCACSPLALCLLGSSLPLVCPKQAKKQVFKRPFADIVKTGPRRPQIDQKHSPGASRRDFSPWSLLALCLLGSDSALARCLLSPCSPLLCACSVPILRLLKCSRGVA